MKWELYDSKYGLRGLMLDGDYFIKSDRFNDMDWFNHLSEKDWVDMKVLLTAFVSAFKAFDLELTEDFFDRYKKAFFARAEDDYVVAVNDAWAQNCRKDRILFSAYELYCPTKLCISDMIADIDYCNA